MVLIVLRHSDDDQPSRYEHDHAITPRGILLARATAKQLIQDYGMPDIIYTSAFRRTRETLNAIKPLLKSSTRTIIDNDASRFFNSSEQKKPGVHPSTMEYKPPIIETWEYFQERCMRHFDKALEQSKTQVVWTISHYLVYRTIAEKYSIELVKHVPFCDFMIVDHGKAMDCRQIRAEKLKLAKLKAIEKKKGHKSFRRAPDSNKMDQKGKRKLDHRPSTRKDDANKDTGKKDTGKKDAAKKEKKDTGGWQNGIYKDSRHFQVEKKGTAAKVPTPQKGDKRPAKTEAPKAVEHVAHQAQPQEPAVRQKAIPKMKGDRIVIGPSLLELSD